ncbi:hypothetical protein IE53DRAFT_329302 [Violaceomyces palustris]|uniref:Uncharacterized protein n=1 Tax=Violaceomyces palustris TaxID=1673888 RepID=A0ACD0NYV9_9BASI|nr:hypothetical protein IE53DRAFT_329302 [Violaceomyces palustris]
MPVTRSFSHTTNLHPSSQDPESEDDVLLLKPTSTSLHSPSRKPILPSAIPLSSRIITSPPAPSSLGGRAAQRMTRSKTATATLLTSTTTATINPRSSSQKHASSKTSTTIATSSSLRCRGRSKSGSVDRVDDSDPSDDELDNNRERIGGCSQYSAALCRRDDSNKENVAPFRCASVEILQQEARDAQQDSAARRTRRRSSLIGRSTSSSTSLASSLLPSSACSASVTDPSPTRRSLRRSEIVSGFSSEQASSSASEAPLPRTPSRRAARMGSSAGLSTFSSQSSLASAAEPRTPTRARLGNGRKRTRQSVGDDLGVDHGQGTSTPTTPLSKLRLSPSRRRTEDCDSIFSSQASSTGASISTAPSCIFDSFSDDGVGSSCSISRGVSPATTVMSSTTEVDISKTSPEQFSNIYAHAKALLRYAAAGNGSSLEAPVSPGDDADPRHNVEVIGREKERASVETFLDQRFGLFPKCEGYQEGELDGDPESGCLYVCGLPGTGKTALLRSILTIVEKRRSVGRVPTVVFINCMSLSHPRLVFGTVLSALGKPGSEALTDAEAESSLGELIKDGRQDILIVLDEMDHLLHSRAHQNILYRLFAWASSSPPAIAHGASSSFSLVGIANSLDLTERFVPLLASKGASPALLHFRPFEADEIVKVVRARLQGLRQCYDADPPAESDLDSPQANVTDGDLPLFSKVALELASRKIAAATGDLRKALDACRLAVELVETEQRKKATAETGREEMDASEPEARAEDGSELAAVQVSAPAIPRSRLLSHLTPSSAPKVGPQHILKVISTVLGSPSLSKIRNLGLHPKLVLLSLMVASLRSKEGLSVLGSGSQRQKAVKSNASVDIMTHGIRIADLEVTYLAILKQDGAFSPLESSELLNVFELLEVQGILSIRSEVDNCTSSSSSSRGLGGLNPSVVLGNGVSPSGKRAAKKQLLAANRMAVSLIPSEDILRGITTTAPALPSFSSKESNNSGASEAVCESIKRMWLKEEERARRSRGWEALAKDKEQVRNEELGGGRGQVASFGL